MSINDAGTLKITNTQMTIDCTGLGSCIYGIGEGEEGIANFTDTTATEGSTPEFEVDAAVYRFSGKGDSGVFICGGLAHWTAPYDVMSHEKLWLAAT